MLDQSDNLDYCYLILCCYFKSIIVQEIGVLNPCFIFSKNLIDKVRQDNNWDKNLVLFIWNVALVAAVTTWYTSGLAFGSVVLNVLYISDITLSFVHLKSSSISQLINGKSRDLQKLI